MRDFERMIEIGDEIKLGYVGGSGKVLFIKTGQGGSVYGYENKYLNLALAMKANYGCTVTVSATTGDDRRLFEREMQVVDGIFGDGMYEIYYMGISKGGLIGCWYGAKYPRIARVVAVNAPLMINFHNRTLPAIKSFERGRLAMVYGSLDSSYRYADFIKDFVPVRIIEGADHQFRGRVELLEEIAVELIKGK